MKHLKQTGMGILTFLSVILLSFGLGNTSAKAQVMTTKYHGKVTAGDDPIDAGQVRLLSDGNLAYGANINPDGTFSITNVEVGTYSVIVLTPNIETGEMKEVYRIEEIEIEPGEFQAVTLRTGEQEAVVIRETIEFKKDEVVTIHTIGAEQIKHSALRRPEELAAATPGVVSLGEDPRAGLSIRGARANATAYYENGVKVIGPLGTPNRAIGSVAVISGGIPAEYGDMQGGILLVETSNKGMYMQGGICINKKEREEYKARQEAQKAEQEGDGSDTLEKDIYRFLAKG